MNAMAVRRLFILNFQDGRRLSESQSDHLVISGERRTAGSASGKICRQGKQELSWNISIRGKKEENSAK